MHARWKAAVPLTVLLGKGKSNIYSVTVTVPVPYTVRSAQAYHAIPEGTVMVLLKKGTVPDTTSRPRHCRLLSSRLHKGPSNVGRYVLYMRRPKTQSLRIRDLLEMLIQKGVYKCNPPGYCPLFPGENLWLFSRCRCMRRKRGSTVQYNTGRRRTVTGCRAEADLQPFLLLSPSPSPSSLFHSLPHKPL